MKWWKFKQLLILIFIGRNFYKFGRTPHLLNFYLTEFVLKLVHYTKGYKSLVSCSLIGLRLSPFWRLINSTLFFWQHMLFIINGFAIVATNNGASLFIFISETISIRCLSLYWSVALFLLPFEIRWRYLTTERAREIVGYQRKKSLQLIIHNGAQLCTLTDEYFIKRGKLAAFDECGCQRSWDVEEDEVIVLSIRLSLSFIVCLWHTHRE